LPGGQSDGGKKRKFLGGEGCTTKTGEVERQRLTDGRAGKRWIPGGRGTVRVYHGKKRRPTPPFFTNGVADDTWGFTFAAKIRTEETHAKRNSGRKKGGSGPTRTRAEKNW